MDVLGIILRCKTCVTKILQEKGQNGPTRAGQKEDPNAKSEQFAREDSHWRKSSDKGGKDLKYSASAMVSKSIKTPKKSGKPELDSEEYSTTYVKLGSFGSTEC